MWVGQDMEIYKIRPILGWVGGDQSADEGI